MKFLTLNDCRNKIQKYCQKTLDTVQSNCTSPKAKSVNNYELPMNLKRKSTTYSINIRGEMFVDRCLSDGMGAGRG
jgi:hypothetical protein